MTNEYKALQKESIDLFHKISEQLTDKHLILAYEEIQIQMAIIEVEQSHIQ